MPKSIDLLVRCAQFQRRDHRGCSGCRGLGLLILAAPAEGTDGDGHWPAVGAAKVETVTGTQCVEQRSGLVI